VRRAARSEGSHAIGTSPRPISELILATADWIDRVRNDLPESRRGAGRASPPEEGLGSLRRGGPPVSPRLRLLRGRGGLARRPTVAANWGWARLMAQLKSATATWGHSAAPAGTRRSCSTTSGETGIVSPDRGERGVASDVATGESTAQIAARAPVKVDDDAQLSAWLGTRWSQRCDEAERFRTGEKSSRGC